MFKLTQRESTRALVIEIAAYCTAQSLDTLTPIPIAKSQSIMTAICEFLHKRITEENLHTSQFNIMQSVCAALAEQQKTLHWHHDATTIWEID